MALLARQDASGPTGAAITLSTATVSDTLVGGQGVHLWVNNASGGARTVTLVTPETVEGALTVQDRAITVAVGLREIPVPSRYNDATTGLATVTVDNATSVTWGAILGSSTP
jgi:hypothetical protein